MDIVRRKARNIEEFEWIANEAHERVHRRVSALGGIYMTANECEKILKRIHERALVIIRPFIQEQ